MGLVTDPLEEIQALAGAGQDHRVVVAGQPDLLQALGEAADGDVVDAQLVQGPLGGGDLRLPAVDDDELRRVREPLGPRRPSVRGRVRGPASPSARRRSHSPVLRPSPAR